MPAGAYTDVTFKWSGGNLKHRKPVPWACCGPSVPGLGGFLVCDRRP